MYFVRHLKVFVILTSLYGKYLEIDFVSRIELAMKSLANQRIKRLKLTPVLS
jgi:hypothetical protein